jgi:cytochrome c oxidase assembly protein subunit 15
MAHLGIWPAAVVFLIVLLKSGRSSAEGSFSRSGSVERRLALAAFFLVCLQATLGGLRVTRETAGFIDLAQLLRIFHGCVAQAFMMTLVVLSVRLSLATEPVAPARHSGLLKTGWLAVVAVYGQLVLGASMRHLGVGLAIPSFPAASPSGSWFPEERDGYTLLNFSHTRIGAILVSFIVASVVWKTLRSETAYRNEKRLAVLAGLLLVVQVLLGVWVIQNQKPPTVTTVHVFVGAALLASLTAIATRVSSAIGFKAEEGL